MGERYRLLFLQEGLDEESLALFDLLKKPNLTKTDITRIKKVAKELLETLKTEKLRVDHWREKEATRDAVRLLIRDYLWSDDTGLPVDCYTDDEVHAASEEVYRHIFRAYPTVPSPFYQTEQSA
jgi:type I restriction enzyme, R subunit